MKRKQSKSRSSSDNTEKIQIYARHGIDENEIPELLGITKAAFREILRKNPDLLQKLKTAKKLADIQVEEALFRRATGYQTIEEHEIYIPENEKAEPLRFKERRFVKKHVLPDATSAQIWLYNRKSVKWSKNPAAVNELSNEELSILKNLTAEAALQNM